MECSRSSGLCFGRSQLFACLHQPWLFDCLECHQLSRWCLNSLFVLHYNQLPGLEAGFRQTSTTTAVVTWEVWHGNQHCVAFISGTRLVLCFLAACDARNIRNYELVFYDVWWDHSVRTCLLRFLGSTSVRWTCTPSKARRVNLQEKFLEHASSDKDYAVSVAHI
jgi:hypothetical protein